MSILSRVVLWLLLLACQSFAESPGPSAALLANPTYSGGIGLLYTCQTNYYVSNSGSDGNPGTQSAPWASMQHADAVGVPSGSCVNVAAGTYNWGSSFNPLHGGTSASPTGYVVYRCQTLNQCFIVYSGAAGTGTWVWGFKNPYYIIDGFDIDGGEAAQFGGLANVCIDSTINDTGVPSHHLWVLNNNIHGCGLGGVGVGDSEYFFVLHNNVYDTAWTSQFEGSGIGLVSLKRLGDNDNPYPAYTPTQYDKAYAPFNNVVSWNHVYNNGCALCFGNFGSFTATANTNGTVNVGNISNLGTSASFTGSISGSLTMPGNILTVTGITGTISPGDTISGAGIFQSTTVAPYGTGGTTGTGGNGTYLLGVFYTGVSSEAMTSTSMAQTLLVVGSGIQPLTYVNTVAGNTITLTRPALTTLTAVPLTFYAPIGNHTDGNGIILDTWCGTPCGGTGTQPYNYVNNQTLVSFNDVQFNGGRGIHAFGTYYVTVANNSTYQNGIDLFLPGIIGELSNAGGINNNWYNNITYAVSNLASPCGQDALFPTCNFSINGGDARGIVDTNIVYQHNIVFGAGGAAMFNNDTMYFNAGNNKTTTDPLYMNESSSTIGNLHLQSTSQAINFAYPHSFLFLPKGTTDSGAWQTGGNRIATYIGPISEFTGSVNRDFYTEPPTALSCSQATTFLTRAAMVATIDRNHTNAYSNLICGMVNDGTWCGTSLDALYILATINQALASLNLCSTSYTLTVHGSPVFTTDRGFLGIDASSSVYLDTGFNPFTVGGNFSLNSAHISLWSLTNAVSTVSGGYAMGAQAGPGLNFGITALLPSFPSGTGDVNQYSQVNNQVFGFHAPPTHPQNSLGYYLATLSGSTLTMYKQGLSSYSYTNTPTNTDENIYILAVNNAGSAASGAALVISVATIGSNQSSGNAASMCHRFNLYQTAVGATVSGIC